MLQTSDLLSYGAEPWMMVHRRAFEVPGDIVDLGCVRWDWSERFFGKKRVIGVDPFGALPYPATDVELFNGVVSTVRGMVQISNDRDSSSLRSNEGGVATESITFADLLERHKIDRIAALKMNVEGAEYELLLTMTPDQLSRIDQICVSFHDWKGAGYGTPEATAAVVAFLQNWYDVALIDARWHWYLFLQR